MKPVRPAVMLALLATVASAGLAQAKPKPKPKPVCNLVTDKTGDANGKDTGAANPFPLPVGPSTSPVPFPVVNAGPSSDALDITSADIAADKKRITAVVRVKKLAMTDPTSAPTGIRWSVDFTAEDIQFTLMAHTNPQGTPSFEASYFVPANGIGTLYGGGVTGYFNMAKNEIHITADNSLFAAQATIKPGAVLTKLDSSAGNEWVIPDPSKKVASGGVLLESTTGYVDTATGPKPYVVGTPSCVTPGK